MSELKLKRWEREFRRDAKTDDLAIFQDHMRRLDLQGTPDLMLEGTIGVMQACSAYAKIDGRPFAPFLEMQRYNPTEQDIARYAFTFDLCGKAFARVLVAAGLGELDLADLYGYPWHNFKVCGYRSFWITHIDWTSLTSAELAQFEREVTDDLRFDYSEDELDFWFDETRTAGALFVNVQDREDF